MLNSLSTMTAHAAAAAAVLVLSATGLATSAPQASAAGSGTECPTNRLCLYFNSNWQGARADFQYGDAGLENELFTDGPYGRNGWAVVVGNNAASVWNRTGKGVTLYDGRDCNWDTKWVSLGPAKVNLSEFSLQNRVSSIRVDGSRCINRDQSSQ